MRRQRSGWRRAVRMVPGVVGAALVVVALGLWDLRAGILAAGGFLLLLDRAIPADPPPQGRHFGDGRIRPPVRGGL